MIKTENEHHFATDLQGTLLYNEPLAEYTTWRVGGPAAKVYKPASINDLALFLRKLPETEPILWLGLDSNTLIHQASAQPTNEYNCGSVFRNPPGNFAARLIESCELKGSNIGESVVSRKHANFIINHQDSVTAADIEALIHLVQTKVREKTTIELMREVHIIGD